MEDLPRKHRPAILWTNNAVTCTSVTHDDGMIEVRLIVGGAIVHREFFLDAEAAAKFTVAKMHVYTPIWPT
jgi:hypothetical protein